LVVSHGAERLTEGLAQPINPLRPLFTNVHDDRDAGSESGDDNRDH
jgi:hypothetical protein